MAHLSRFKGGEEVQRPNPNFGFLSVLPGRHEGENMNVLKSLAAQVKRVCDREGLKVNSFEEYQCNKVFSGRNWNHGEVIELVLRGPNGRLYPTHWLLRVLCHELAHNLHMNHGPAFHAYMRHLQKEVEVLRGQGHFGEGFYSTGFRVGGGEEDLENPLVRQDLAEHLCGGAQRRSRPRSSKRRRTGLSFASGADRYGKGPTRFTGRQTERKRKAGGRNEPVFKRMEEEGAEGRRLDGGKILSSEEKKALSAARAKAKGKGKAAVDASLGSYKKRANTKSAAGMRAAAAMKRMKKSQGLPTTSDEEESTTDEEDVKPALKGAHVRMDDFKSEEEEGEEDYEPLPESDDRRLELLRESLRSRNGQDDDGELDELDDEEDDDGGAWEAYNKQVEKMKRDRLKWDQPVAEPSGSGKAAIGKKLFDHAEESSDDEIQLIESGPSSCPVVKRQPAASSSSSSAFPPPQPHSSCPPSKTSLEFFASPPRAASRSLSPAKQDIAERLADKKAADLAKLG